MSMDDPKFEGGLAYGLSVSVTNLLWRVVIDRYRWYSVPKTRRYQIFGRRALASQERRSELTLTPV